MTSEHFASENERLQRELDEAVKLSTRLRVNSEALVSYYVSYSATRPGKRHCVPSSPFVQPTLDLVIRFSHDGRA